jgi:hypothetical protein
MVWEDFQELPADRWDKGLNVVNIVCGPYPDEGFSCQLKVLSATTGNPRSVYFRDFQL